MKTSTLRLCLSILALVLVGTPVAAYLWETFNQLLSGHFYARRVLLSLPLLFVFYLLLRFMARIITGWEERETAPQEGR